MCCIPTTVCIPHKSIAWCFFFFYFILVSFFLFNYIITYFYNFNLLSFFFLYKYQKYRKLLLHDQIMMSTNKQSYNFFSSCIQLGTLLFAQREIPVWLVVSSLSILFYICMTIKQTIFFFYQYARDVYIEENIKAKKAHY